MHKININILLLLVIVLVTSCDNSEGRTTITRISSTTKNILVDFTNKPVLNSSEIGNIRYKSNLDTFELNKNTLRARVLYIGQFKKTPPIEELKKMTLDSFSVINKKEDVAFNFTFDKVGEFELGGYFKDIVILTNYNKDGSDLKITHEIEIRKKVTVVKEYTDGDEKNDISRTLLRFNTNSIVNQPRYGEIIYKSELDSIKLSEEDERTIAFHFGKFKNVRTIPELEGKTTEAYGISKNENVIPFWVTFEEEGEFILDGFVEDIVFLKNYNTSGDARMITNQTKISKKVTVVKE